MIRLEIWESPGRVGVATGDAERGKDEEGAVGGTNKQPPGTAGAKPGWQMEGLGNVSDPSIHRGQGVIWGKQRSMFTSPMRQRA